MNAEQRRRSVKRRILLVWGSAGFVGIVLAGCTRTVVDPGPSGGLPVAPGHPVPSTGPLLPAPNLGPGESATPPELGSVPRLPASSVIRLPPDIPAFYHTVSAGDTLSGIARRYGTTAETIRTANGLDRDAVLQPGQRLQIPNIVPDSTAYEPIPQQRR